MLKIAWMYLLHNCSILYLTISYEIYELSCTVVEKHCNNMNEHNGCFNALCNFVVVSACTKAFLALAITFKCSAIMGVAEQPSKAGKSSLKVLGNHGF